MVFVTRYECNKNSPYLQIVLWASFGALVAATNKHGNLKLRGRAHCHPHFHTKQSRQREKLLSQNLISGASTDWSEAQIL